ncbi:hypothetical protein ACOI22_03460 [Glaciecola sp. 2405UD65-10]|uniref:hypothetical protein n=1 Tax=Glaciecola sp. 2405UD65-10 TaxID=3397244 RepID=UPI003B5B9451
MKMVIGIDPDSERHGVAIYIGGELKELKQLTLIDLIKEFIVDFSLIGQHPVKSVSFSIEDVCANNFVYGRNTHQNVRIQSNIAKKVGACQQSQVELIRMLKHFRIPYKLHKPTRKNWAKNREQFELVTGWRHRSNEDTRSAAYFGFLEAGASS